MEYLIDFSSVMSQAFVLKANMTKVIRVTPQVSVKWPTDQY